MDSFFAAPMHMGRYPEKSRGAVFSHDRQYFEQILYKNAQFRYEYAQAYAAWRASLQTENMTPVDILAQRIQKGIAYTGEARVQKHFAKVAEIANAQCAQKLPENLSFADTLPGGAIATDPQYAAHMQLFMKFWLRLALPEVEEDDI